MEMVEENGQVSVDMSKHGRGSYPGVGTRKTARPKNSCGAQNPPASFDLVKVSARHLVTCKVESGRCCAPQLCFGRSHAWVQFSAF